jgi:hypothetical protein
MTDSPEHDGGELSLLDLLVTVAENWVLLVAGPLLVGAAAFCFFLYFQPQSWRTTATVELPLVEMTRILPAALEGATPPPGLSIAKIDNGLTIADDGTPERARLEVVLESPTAARVGLSFVLEQLAATVERDALPSAVETAQARRETLEQEVALRDSVIQRLTQALEDSKPAEDFDALSYAQMASTHNELMLARDQKRGELEILLAGPSPSTSSSQSFVVETEEPSRIGRSPLVMTLVAVLGTGFVLLLLVFIRSGLNKAVQNPESRQKINRIRRAFWLKDKGTQV